MKRKRRGKKHGPRNFRLWTHAEARAAVPYLRSVMRSLREHMIETRARKWDVYRFGQKAGKPDRAILVAREEAREQAQKAEERFEEAARELWVLDIYPVDAILGLAQVPFLHDDQLAWYLFDLFDPSPFRFWRFQKDPEDARRPITGLQKGVPNTTWKV
jgi:hypothetical protein